TSLVGLDAVRDYSGEGGPRVTGYQLTNTAEATIREIATVGALIDAALGAGATSLDGLAFRLADPTDALAEARRRAVADARARATVLAGEAGVRLGPVAAITEGGQLPPGGPRPVEAMRMKAAADVATPVEAGTDELEVTVSVSFKIE
ncbi:MAG TPA: SIMPL domain-containing protein, partial [Nakamurella sp.]